jgi:hypothetical protein
MQQCVVFLWERLRLAAAVAVGRSEAGNKELLNKSALMTLGLFVHYRIVEIPAQNRKEDI